jgi:hypothetical protein
MISEAPSSPVLAPAAARARNYLSRPWLLPGALTLPHAALAVAFLCRIAIKGRATTVRPERDSILKQGFR